MRAGSTGRGARHLLLAGGLAALLLAFTASGAVARPGQLDRGFGRDGIAGESLEPHFPAIFFTAVSEEEDGSILATRDHVFRYTSSGQLDPTFPPREPEPTKVQAVQPDGKVLERGEGGGIRRLNPDGTPDQTFHGGESEGVPLYAIGDIAVLPSGKILVAGDTGYSVSARRIVNQIGVVRLNADGTLDRSFGGEGLVELRRDDGIEGETLPGIAIRPNEGVVVVTDRFVAGLNPDGSLDGGYGDDGKAPLEGDLIVGFDAGNGGRLTVAGSTGYFNRGENEKSDDFYVAHLGPDGRFDPAYSTGAGIARVDGGEDMAATALFEADGAVAVAGVSSSTARCPYTRGCPLVPSLARFDSAGNPEAGFGASGLVRFEKLAGRSLGVGVNDLAARRGGGMIVAGGGPGVAFLAALQPDGGLDASFGNAGLVEERKPVPSGQRMPRALAVSRAGKILAEVYTNAGINRGSALIRYTRNGKIDRSYADGKGYVRVSLDSLVALAQDRAGRALALTEDGLLTRITPAGEIDPGFNGGHRHVGLKHRRAQYRVLAVQPDGRLLVGGTTSGWGEPAHIRVARLLPDGKLDRSFGRGGYATVGCRSRGRCVPAQILLPGDGRILVVATVRRAAGRAVHGSRAASRIGLFRLLPDGRPDHDFGGDGLVTARVTEHSEAKAAILSRGGIVVAGWCLTGHGPGGLLVRFRLDGHLDRSFGEGGVSRTFPSGSGIANGVFAAGHRLLVVMKGDGPPVVGFHRDGHPDRSYLRLKAKLMRGRVSAPVSAMQGGKLLLGWAWRPRKGVPSELRLARLSAR